MGNRLIPPGLLSLTSLFYLEEAGGRGGGEYWKKTLSELQDKDDIVLIHVCDENRQTTKDFCCKRNILVTHMKYFEGFLAENENGYDDIDISVHCDVDIFEWLMCYIHSPHDPPPFDKCLVISILISSDFLQMLSLVELCLKFVSQNLTDIIKLPIDLSCISEKLLNKLSVLTPSSVLASATDRKDKILNKLYKRRVELDFSRKSGPRSSIASSLTCCASCHAMYLENYSASLVCRKAEAVINFRGKPVRRHNAISGWSLTSYLKSLHSHGLSWECIYWHVWGACTVFRIEKVVFCAAESYRYNVLDDGLSINTQVFIDESNSDSKSGTDALSGTSDALSGSKILPFSLYREDDFDSYMGCELMLRVDETINSMDEEACDPAGLVLSGGVINRDNLQSGLNPIRKIDILPLDTFSLIKSQQKLISGKDHATTIANVCRQQSESRIAASGQGRHKGSVEYFDFSNILFGGNVPSKTSRQGSNRDLTNGEGDEPSRGRSRSRSQTRKGNTTTSVNRDDDSLERSTSVDASTGQSNLRSRSMSGGPSRRISSNGTGLTSGNQGGSNSSQRKLPPSSSSTQGNSSKPPLGSTTSTHIGTAAEESVSVDDEEVSDPFSTLSSIPPDVRSYFSGKLGPIDGIWLSTHPLALLPQAYFKTLNSIQAIPPKDLSQSKRTEWELDLLREFDDTRMEKYAEFLVKCRKFPEKQLSKFAPKPEAVSAKKEVKDSTRRRFDASRREKHH